MILNADFDVQWKAFVALWTWLLYNELRNPIATIMKQVLTALTTHRVVPTDSTILTTSVLWRVVARR